MQIKKTILKERNIVLGEHTMKVPKVYWRVRESNLDKRISGLNMKDE